MKVVRYADRADLMARRFDELTKPTFPEYMNQSEVADLYWGRTSSVWDSNDTATLKDRSGVVIDSYTVRK